MEVSSFVTASATITRVTELQKGNVYKRYEKPSYGEPKLTYGVVTDVLHNGDEAVLQTLEFEPSWSDCKITLKTFGGGEEIVIYPATQAELNLYLEEGAEALEREVKEKANALFKAKEKQARIQQVIAGTLLTALSEPTISDKPVITEVTPGEEDLPYGDSIEDNL